MAKRKAKAKVSKKLIKALDKIENPTPMVLQKDARGLREALAKVYRHVPAQLQAYINTALSDYAERLAPYCTHPELIRRQDGNTVICNDCGHIKEFNS